MADPLLQGRRVLVVEDEFMIAEAVSRGLRKAGAEVIGPASSVPSALSLLAEAGDVDAAVLDINLGDHKVYPVVDVLLGQHVRCVFATGNDAADVPPAYAALTRFEKPVDTSCLIEALADHSRRPEAEPAAHAKSDLAYIEKQLSGLVQVAETAGHTFLAAKLCEALDAASGTTAS